MGQKSLLIVGLGDLAGHVLEFLAREPNMAKITAVDINEDWGVRKTNSALAGASQMGYYPDIEFVQLDAFDIDRMAEFLAKFKPTVIYNGMTLQSWWVITKLPEDAYKAIDEARFGPWFPMHFVPAYKLMQAVKKAGIETLVVNSAFPDLVNPALAKIGLTPTVGIGNIDNICCTLRLVASKMFEAPMRSVQIFMVVAHYLSYYATRFGDDGGAPYYLKVMVDDRDVTPEIDRREFLANLKTIGRRPGSIQAHPVVASSACKIIQGMLFDTKELGHAPGPNGLPGGYPIRLGASGVEVFLPEDLTLDEAVRMNNEAQVLEGVESIEDDGTVVITDRAAAVFRKLLDFDRKRYTVENCEADWKELDQKFKRWAGRFTR
jgi:hypothetical protein